MKKMVMIGIALVVLAGGGAGVLWWLKLPPFKGKPAKAAKAVAPVKPAEPAAPVVSPAVVTEPRPVAPVKRPAQQASADPAKDEQAEARITRLASVYEQMPAEEAGRIIAKLPDPLVDKLLRRMDERQVGKLLLTLNVDRAARLTQSLAQ